MTQPPTPPYVPGPQPYGVPPAPANQPYPPPQYVAPPMPPRPKGWALGWKIPTFIGAGVVLAVAAAVILSGGVGSNAPTKDDLDVTLSTCRFEGGDTLPAATVGFTVTNKTDRTRDVRLEWEYRDSGGARLDTDSTVVRGVRPGDTVRGEESTLLDAAPPGESAKCHLVGVAWA